MTLDELLLEWSYRSERGYPTLDNPSDISTLKQILKELNLSEIEIEDVMDNLPDDKPGGDDLTNPGTDGMEDSSVEKEKEKQFQKSAEKDLDQAIDDELDAENLEACEMGRKEVMRIYDKLAAKGVFSTPQAVNKFINKACLPGICLTTLPSCCINVKAVELLPATIPIEHSGTSRPSFNALHVLIILTLVRLSLKVFITVS